MSSISRDERIYRTLSTLKIIFLVILYIAISVFVSIQFTRTLKKADLDVEMKLVLEWLEFQYVESGNNMEYLKNQHINFGDENQYTAEIFAISNKNMNISGSVLPFDTERMIYNFGELKVDNFAYYYMFFKDTNLCFILKVPYEYVSTVSGDIIGGLVAFNLIITVLVFLLFLVLKNMYYNPIIKIERHIEEIIEDGYTPGEDFNLIIRSHPLSSRFEQVIVMLKELLEREFNETILRKQTELNVLQSQINPHFLYNTLDTIRGQALWEGMDSIAEMTHALASCLRYSINTGSDMVTLSEELDNVKNYIKIQQTRFSDKLEFEMAIDEENDNKILSYKIPKLTIQPIVENAVFHGLEKKRNMGKVQIKVFATDTRLSINIIDNGLGIPRERLKLLNKNLYLGQTSMSDTKNESRQSIGLYNVNQRIKLYYGDNFGLRIKSFIDEGTNVEIIVPIIQ